MTNKERELLKQGLKNFFDNIFDWEASNILMDIEL